MQRKPAFLLDFVRPPPRSRSPTCAGGLKPSAHLIVRLKSGYASSIMSHTILIVVFHSPETDVLDTYVVVTSRMLHLSTQDHISAS